MPLPFLPEIRDDQLFHCIAPVIVAYACVVFVPRWRHTNAIVHGFVFFYSLLYALLVGQRLAVAPVPDGAGFNSLSEVVALFSDKDIVFAGWVHYIAFDLFVSR